MIGDTLARLATIAGSVAPSATVGIFRCLAILLVSMALSKFVRSAKAGHYLLAVGIISLPLVLVLSFTPGVEIPVLPSRVSAAPTLSEVVVQTVQPAFPDIPEITEITGSAVTPDTGTRVETFTLLPLIGLLAWLAGWGIATGRQVARHIAAALMIHAAGPAPSTDVQAYAYEGRGRLGIARPVRIAIHGGTCVPFTRGTLRPVICLPNRLLELAPQQIKLILLHELAHIRRLDTLVAAAARFACAVVWFLPPVWIAFQWLVHARETACDDVVLAIAPDASGYATTLVLTAGAARVPAPSAVTSGTAPLERRIRNILRPRAGEEHLMKPAHRALIAAVVLALATAALIRCAPGSHDSTSVAVEPMPRMSWPLEDGRGNVTTVFGPYSDPFTGKTAMHSGLDIAWAAGLPVLAAADGVVEKIGVNDLYGVFLILKHAGQSTTLYTHLEGTTVYTGDAVAQGQSIGQLGNTGRTTGPHLHFGIFYGTNPVDPLAHLTDVPASALRQVREPTAAGQGLTIYQESLLISWPLPQQEGTITEGFGWALYPFEPAKGQGYLHEGIDIAAAPLTPVLAAGDGVVAATGFDNQAGVFVQISHIGGLSTRYEHLSNAEVETGHRVRRGEKIGRVGNTGLSTGPHLHFVIYHGRNEYLDPLLFLTGTPPGSTMTSGRR